MTNQFAQSELIGLTTIAPVIDLRGKVAVITGAADGIGRAVAKAYHHFGAHVIAIDVQQEKLKSLADELGSRITWAQFDLSKRSQDDYNKLGDFMSKSSPTGMVDIYLINAGIIKKFDGPIAQRISTTPMEEADDMYAINLRSHLAIYQQLLPIMNPNGRIVLTSSPIVGRKDPASANYAWTKKALEDQVATIGMELRADGSNILVTGYVPPPVQAWLRAHWKNEPLYANPMPQDVVELPLRLASPYLLPEHAGKIFTYVDKRVKGIVPADGGEKYDANNRTENGFDLGINVRKMGEGGGTEGATFLETYDTYDARQLTGEPPVSSLDENVRLRDCLRPPEFIAKAMKATAATVSSQAGMAPR